MIAVVCFYNLTAITIIVNYRQKGYYTFIAIPRRKYFKMKFTIIY